jgi:cytidine deaminase
MTESDDLLAAAIAARERAYAPYSKFTVGAAIRTPSGAIYTGCNVENASYPEGWCAETSAIAAMVAAGEGGVIVEGDRLPEPRARTCGRWP